MFMDKMNVFNMGLLKYIKYINIDHIYHSLYAIPFNTVHIDLPYLRSSNR